MRRPILTLALAGLALAGFVFARPPAITSADQEQPRLDQPAPLPAGASTVSQTFVSQHNGLSAVEILAVVYPAVDRPAQLTLRLLDGAGAVVAEQAWTTIAHNATLRLEFAPQPASAGQQYELQLTGAADGGVTAWAHSLATAPGGQLRVAGQPRPGSLRYSAVYTYLAPDIARDTIMQLGRVARLLVPFWLVLFVPGQAVLAWVGPRPGLSGWARLGVALSLSLSLLPLAWLWASLLPWAWSRASLLLLYLVLGAWVVGWGLWNALRRRAGSPTWGAAIRLGQHASSLRHALILAGILLISVAVRLIAVRDLAVPAWVDSPHHALLINLLMRAGRIPTNYLPLLPVNTFHYHIGVHTLFAASSWITQLPPAEIMLVLGQVLNGLMPLAVYTAAELLTRRRGPGLAAAATVGLISFFPGYYVTWGRYTQLAGLILLAPALGLVWQVLWRRRGSAPRRLDVVCLGVIAAGLLLTHYRVFFFFGIFAAAALMVRGRPWGAWKPVLAAAGLGALLALPWEARLWQEAVLPVLRQPAELAATANYNEFPLTYFQSSLERGWLAAAAACLVWGLLRRIAWLRAVGLWVGLVFGLVNIGPGTWLVNNNSWAISLFLPASLALGWGVHRFIVWGLRQSGKLAGKGRRWPRLTQALATLLLGAFFASAGASMRHGLQTQASIVNPTTVLATAADAEALAWVAANVPRDAVFLVNSWNWQGNIWASPDGGAWLLPLTGRAATLPPLDYTFGPAEWTAAIVAFQQRANDIQDVNATETLAFLTARGVSHIYIGARGGSLRPEMFADSPHYRVAYTNGSAWVYALQPAP